MNKTQNYLKELKPNELNRKCTLMKSVCEQWKEILSSFECSMQAERRSLFFIFSLLISKYRQFNMHATK